MKKAPRRCEVLDLRDTDLHASSAYLMNSANDTFTLCGFGFSCATRVLAEHCFTDARQLRQIGKGDVFLQNIHHLSQNRAQRDARHTMPRKIDGGFLRADTQAGNEVWEINKTRA